MDKREYLRSLGFQVGERGRFSAEMQTAIANAGIDFDAPVKKAEYVEVETITPSVPPQEAVRKPRQLYGFTAEGHKVGFITCRRCSYHMMYCECKRGILAPSIVSRCDDPLVTVGREW